MQREQRSRPAPLTTFEGKLEHEEEILDGLVALLARGQLPDDVWRKLHDAAVRDGRLAELGFAYSTIAQGQRLKALAPPAAAEVHYQAGLFFADLVGDVGGAASYLEKALGFQPSHGGAFEKLASMLARAGEEKRLGELYVDVASRASRGGEQLALLRKAAECFEHTAPEGDRIVDVYQQILKLEPQDEVARRALETRYLKQNRLRDVVRLLEQALAAEPPLPFEQQRRLRGRLIELYATQLHEPERCLPHVEALLAEEPHNADAHRVAGKLLVIKGIAARAAAALASAQERLGNDAEVVRLLTIELEHTRGPRRREVLRRLGVLKQEKLLDLAGAFETFEAALGLDASDDELRERYAQVAFSLERPLDAARTLGRVGMMVKEPGLRTRLSAEVGELLLAGGDVKKARSTFGSILAATEADDGAVLRAARALLELYDPQKEAAAVADALERMVRLEPDHERRQEIAERLAGIYSGSEAHRPKAIAAWQALLETAGRRRALEALLPLYETAGMGSDLAKTLEALADFAESPMHARELLLRAAEVRAEAGETVQAAATYRALVERFGPSRDLLDRWMPLLEAAKQWADLAAALGEEARLLPEAERVPVFLRIGQLALGRLKDVPLAIDAWRRVLATDPEEKTSRAALEKLVAGGDHRLAAAQVLEPLYRRESATTALLKLLDLRSTLAPTPEERLAALEEAVTLRDGSPQEMLRLVDIAGRGLVEAMAAGLAPDNWFDRLDAFAEAASDPKRKAAILAKALGEGPVTSARELELARRAGDAMAQIGEVGGALSAYRRALSFDASSSELVAVVDDLLRAQGSPRERVALYRAALERETDRGKRTELRHIVAGIERRDLVDREGALQTYGELVQENPDDRAGHLALVELYTETQRWEPLRAELERYLDHASGDDAHVARARLAELALEAGDKDAAHRRAEELLGEESLPGDIEDTLLRIAESLGKPSLLAHVLRRRAGLAVGGVEEVAWLERLASVLAQAGDGSALETYRDAARKAAGFGDDAVTRRLWQRVLERAPRDEEAARALVAMAEAADEFHALPPLLEVLIANAGDEEVRGELLLRLAKLLAERLGQKGAAAQAAGRAFISQPSDRGALEVFERYSIAADVTDEFLRAIDGALLDIVLDPGDASAAVQRAELVRAKVRVLAAKGRRDDGIVALQRLLEDDALPAGHQQAVAEALEALLGDDDKDERTVEGWRWIFGWRFKHLPDPERPLLLSAWAEAEESRFGDPARALAIHRQRLVLEPESGDALSAVARLSLAQGDLEGALAALDQKRLRSEGTAALTVDKEIATLLLEHGADPGVAFDRVARVLDASPQDGEAIGLLVRLLGSPPVRSRAADLLEKVASQAEDADAQIQLLGRLLAGPMGSSAEATRRREWHGRLVAIYEERGELEEALQALVRALSELPADAQLWDRAEDLARATQKPNEVAALFQRALEAPMAKEEALALGERAVAFFEEWFEDTAGVVKILERLLEVDPSASWAFDRLKLLFNAAERWDDLFVLYDRALTVLTGPSRLELLEDAAQVAKDFAGNADRATAYLEQILAVRPQDARIVASLERLYERSARHRDLIVLLHHQLGSSEPSAAHRARVRIASVWLDDVNDAAAALAATEDVIAHAPSGDGSAEKDVVDLLERVLAKALPGTEIRIPTLPPSPGAAPRRGSIPPPRRDSTPPGRRDSVPPMGGKRGLVRQRAASLLRQSYATLGRDADLARVIEVELETIEAPAERSRRHLEVAEISLRLGAKEKAFDHYEALVLLESDVREHREHLAQLAEDLGRAERHATILAQAASAAALVPLRVELRMQAGLVRADILRDDEGAIDLFLAVLEEETASPEAQLVVARRVEPLLHEAGRKAERLDVLELLARLDGDDAKRVDVLRTAARLAMDLGEADRAIAAWEALLVAKDADREALDGLVSIHEREARYPDLVHALTRRANLPGPTDDVRRDRVRVARIFRAQLADTNAAIEAWRSLETDLGADDETTEELASLLAETQRHEELADLLSAAAARSEVRLRKAELLRRLGDVQAQSLGRLDTAVESYAQALVADPADAQARVGLRGALDHAATRARAVEVLVQTFVGQGEWRDALGLLETRLEVAGDDATRVLVLLEAAGWAEQHCGDAGAAFEAVRRAFLLAPDDTSLATELVRLAESSGAWASAAEAIAEAIDTRARGADVALLVRLRHQEAQIRDTQLGDGRAALALYQHVLEDAPSRTDVARAAVRVACDAAHWDAVAHATLLSARATGILDSELLLAAERAASTSAHWDGLTRAFHSAAEAFAPLAPTVVRDLEAQLAAWHRDRRNDADAAEAAFQRALVHAPEDARLLSALADLQRRHKGKPLVDSLVRLSLVTGGDLDLLREAGEVALSVGDRDDARAILERTLALASDRWLDAENPSSPVSVGSPTPPSEFVEWSLRELVQLHTEDALHGRVVELLVDASRLPFDRDVGRGMRHEAASVAHARMGDSERAAALYLALFEEDARDQLAIDRLVAIYQGSGQTYPLLALRRRQVARAQTVEHRVELRLEVAALLVELEDADRAIGALEESLAEAERDPRTVAELARILEKIGRFAPLAELFARQAELAEKADEPANAADAWERAAAIALGKCDDARAAIAHHQRVLALEARPSSFDALARIHESLGEAAKSAGYLKELRQRVADEERASVTLRLADALTAAGEAGAARHHLEEDAALPVVAEPVFLRLSDVYRKAGETLALAKLTARGASHAPDKASHLARLREAADLFRGPCNDPESAVPLLERAADLDPESQPLRLTLADTFAAAGRFDDARTILRALVESYGHRRPRERAPVHRSLARLELRRGDRAQALVELDVATRIDSSNAEVLQALAELSRDEGQLERAERSYRALLVVLRKPDESEGAISRAEVFVELSRIARRQGDEARGVELLESALEAAGKSVVEARAFGAALRRGDEGPKLGARYRSLLETQAEACLAKGDTEAGRGLLVELSRVAADADAAGAAQILERALAIGGGDDAPILGELDVLYTRLGNDEARGRILERRLSSARTKGEGVPLREALLGLATFVLKDPAAIGRASELLLDALDAGVPAASIQPLLLAALATAKSDPTFLALCEKVGREPGGEALRLEALATRVSAGGADEDDVRAAVDLARGLGDAARAEAILRTYLEAGAEGEGRAWVLSTLGDLRLAAGDDAGAVDLYGRAAEDAAPEEARERLFVVARLASEKLDDAALAAATYEKLVQREPADRDAWEPLLELYRRLGEHRKLADLIAAVLDVVDDPKELSRLRFERVRVMMDDLGAGEEVVEALREIVDDDPSQHDAAMLLSSIYARTGREDELAALLQRQLDAAKDRADAPNVASLSLRLGALLARREPLGAREVYYTGLDWDAQSSDLLRALLAVLGDGADVTERADVMGRLLPLEQGEDAEKLALALAALRAEMWDEDGAERALEAGYAAHPRSAVLRERLEASYRERSAWDKLANAHLLYARAAEVAAEKVARFKEAARLFREEMSNPAAAAESLEEAVAVAPSDEALVRELVDLLEAAGRPGDAARHVGVSIERLPEGERGALLLRRAGLRGAAGDHQGALEDIEAACALGAAPQEVALEQRARLRDALYAASDAAGGRNVALELARRYEKAGDAERARAELMALLRFDGRDPVALVALATLEEREERWDGASALLYRLVGVVGEDEIVAVALRLADACERAGRLVDAREGLERARQAHPADAGLIARLEQVYEASGAVLELAELHLSAAKATLDVQGRFAHLARAGDLLVRSELEPERAVDALREASQLQAGDLDVLALLADALVLAGRDDEATELLTQTVAAQKGRRAKELAPLYHRLAYGAAREGDQPRRLSWLSQGLEMDAQNAPIAAELAEVALALGQLDVAGRALRAVTMLRGPCQMPKAEAYFHLGAIAHAQGDSKRAALLLKRALDEDATLDAARDLLSQLDG